MLERNRPTARSKMTVKKKFVYLFLAVFLLSTLVVTFFGKKGYVDIQRARKRYLELQIEVNKLTREKEKLEEEIKKLETNPGAIEKEAREKLWLVRPDEKILVKSKDKDI
ncbi:MAG: septum formation initiator family protein [Candidatus Aminicenantes bacterium]|nr:septum formation initiator family protein [Candidatus Aminicenantes bacterium]